MVAASVFLTHALQFYVPMEIIWKEVGGRFSDSKQNVAEYTIRISLVVCAFTLPIPKSLPIFILPFFFTSADAHCDGGHCIAANRCIRIVNRCCVPEHARSNHATDHRIGHLLGARGSGQIELALVEKLLPDLLRHYWIRARRLCQH